MQRTFFLAKNGAHVGPHTFEEVLAKLSSREHQWVDYVYDEQSQSWIVLMEHPAFSSVFNEGIAEVNNFPIPKKKGLHTEMVSEIKSENYREKEWFTLRDGNNYGPFSLMDLIQMLQEKTLFEYDYVWNERMTAWTRVAETNEFNPESIRQLKRTADSDLSEIFFRRRHARARYGCSLIVHDHKMLYRGRSLEISEGGAGVMIENKILEPGQSVYLHFQPGDGVPPFNAVCSVVNKQWVKDTTKVEDPVKYGVKFTSISQAARLSIRGFTEKKKAA